MANNKIFNVNGAFKVASNLTKSLFGASFENTSFPGIDYVSWGDTHDSLAFKNDSRALAAWDDNDGNTSEILLLYIKTSTADLRIYKTSRKYEFYIANALVNSSVRVYYNGNSTTYNDYSTQNLSYNLGTNCNLTLKLIGGSADGGYYDVKISWDDIPNLLEIGGGIATVLRTVALNSAQGTGKPSYWNGGHGSVSGFNFTAKAADGSNLTKSELIAAAASSPGNSAFDKVVFDWNSSSEFKALSIHSPKSIKENKIVYVATTVASDTDKVTLANHGLNDGGKICIQSSTATYLDGALNVSLTGEFFVANSTANDFKLTKSLEVPIVTIDITSNGTINWHSGKCGEVIVCPALTDIANDVGAFDLLPPPAVFIDPTTVVSQNVGFFEIP